MSHPRSGTGTFGVEFTQFPGLAQSAFTLLEILVVVALIAALSLALLGGLGGSGGSAALQSAQATVSSLVTAARTKAAATNCKTRLLLNVEPSAPDRFLRLLVLQRARQAGSSPVDWDTLQRLLLPADTFVVPASLSGLVADPAEWKRISNPAADLNSDLFQNQSLSCTIEGDTAAQEWTGVAFTPNGTLAAVGTGLPPKGYLIVASGRARPPGSFAAGASPVELINPASVRGLVLSVYGVPALLNERSAL
ncbi:MAG TPA: prepilin-type N-terminal cleavage/methylation domain-containing protein [Lacunisphaera sp.]|nr:prepilin-type N-terminal cleavage/methylation domain-containing protein [Lacunisphaera sp.]